MGAGTVTTRQIVRRRESLLSPKPKPKDAWTVHVDPSLRKTYYFNEARNEGVWEMPEDYDNGSLLDTHRTMRKFCKQLTEYDPNLPQLLRFFNEGVWKMHHDEATGRNYWVNQGTREA